MKPKSRSKGQDDLFQPRLADIIDPRHELVLLGERIDWQWLEDQVEPLFAECGRPANPTRLMVGLHLLKHMQGISDEEVVERWRENPYWQAFCGEEHFQHRFPIERSGMTHWRQRLGAERLEALLQESLRVAHDTKALHIRDLERVAVDTTVQPKNVTHPTDWKLLRRAIVELGKMAKSHGVPLRQSYVRVSKHLEIKAGRYAHAKQFGRMNRCLRKLRTYLGRLERDIRRKIEGDDALQEVFGEVLTKAMRLRFQRRQDSDKIYSWHAPEVECIGKGKAHKPYEFGCKVSVATTVNAAKGGHFVLQSRALHGRPFDGHTLAGAIEDIRRITGVEPKRIYVDKGYRGHNHPRKFRVFRSGQKRGVVGVIKKELRRRAAVEPLIGHMKNDGHLSRNYLKGTEGDAINAVLCGAGHNFRLLLRFFASLWLYLTPQFLATFTRLMASGATQKPRHNQTLFPLRLCVSAPLRETKSRS